MQILFNIKSYQKFYFNVWLFVVVEYFDKYNIVNNFHIWTKQVLVIYILTIT